MLSVNKVFITMEEFTYDLPPKTNKPDFDIGLTCVRIIDSLLVNNLPELQAHFPFTKAFECQNYLENGIVVVRLQSLRGTGVPRIGKLKDTDLIAIAEEIIEKNKFPAFSEVYDVDPSRFNFDTLTYIGSHENLSFSFRHIESFIIDYLTYLVIPQLFELNKRQVLNAIPVPPQYNVQKVLDSIFVIETPSQITQGTCFFLNTIGFVTCAHCINEDSFVYRANNISQKFPVKIAKKNDVIDLAIFNAEGMDVSEGLDMGDSDSIVLNTHLAVAGFPNHNYGDTGIFSPGLVIGFRTVSSIKRFLINTPLIAGNSGGPILSAQSTVIGVAVTGADKMENAALTENHGVIPIAAINLI